MVYDYEVTKLVLIRHKTRGFLTCNKCGKRFKLGDKVIAKRTRNNSTRLHKNCYENMFFEVED